MKVILCPALNVVSAQLEPYLPYGLLTLQAATSTLEGIEVVVFQPSKQFFSQRFQTSSCIVDALVEELSGLLPDVIGFSLVCNSAHYSLHTAEILKSRNPRISVIVGGPYVTKLSSAVLKSFPFIDAVFVGESDETFVAALSSMIHGKHTLVDIPGVRSRNSAFITRPVIENLDSLASVVTLPDYYSHLDTVRSHVSRSIAAPLEASRGCPLQCSFCSTRQVWGAVVRRMGSHRLFNEMQRISAMTGDNFFSLIGDNLGVPKNKFLDFCREFTLINNDRFTWGCSLKLDRFSIDELQLIWNAGCRSMFVGVESASQITLDKVNKAARIDCERAGVFAAISMGFKVETSFIIGFPWESEDDVKGTYELHCAFLKAGAARSQIGILCPIPGTDIVAKGKIIFDGLTSYVTQDDVFLADRHKAYIEQCPALFTHFGRYETPNIRKVILKTYIDAGMRVAQLHLRQHRINMQISAGNHGRTVNIQEKINANFKP